MPSLDLTSRWLITSLSACAHEIIASLSWAGGRRLATRCMVSGTVSAWIVVAVAWPEIAAWMDTIEQEFDRLGAFDDVAMGVGVAELLDRHRADQGRLARSSRARDDHHALGHPVVGEDFRLDILLTEGLRQIANRADDDIGARASACGDRCDVAAKAQRSLPRRADLVHDVD